MKMKKNLAGRGKSFFAYWENSEENTLFYYLNIFVCVCFCLWLTTKKKKKKRQAEHVLLEFVC